MQRWTLALSLAGVLAGSPAPRAVADEWTVAGSGAAHLKVEAEGSPLDSRGATVLLSSDGTTDALGDASSGVEAAPYHGRRIALSAELYSEGAQAPGWLWIRIEGDSGEPEFQGNAVSDRTRNARLRTLTVPVSPTARRIAYGVVHRGSGSTRVSGLSLRLVDDGPATPEADAVLDAAIELVRERAYYAGRIDWDVLPDQLRRMNRGASSAADAYPVIQFMLRRLGDRHSFLMSPAAAKSSAAAGRGNPPMQVQAGADGIVRIVVPTYAGSDPTALVDFAKNGQSEIQAAASHARCGFLVDLRENQGGNMWPMMGGLRALLGEPPYGFHVNRKDVRSPWRLPNVYPKVAADLSEKPLAILTGPKTASSGEAVAIALHGRKRTRSFGEATRGLSSSNSVWPLPDGGNLVLTTGLQADRNGSVYGSALLPDEPTENDNAPAAAASWLERDSHCR